MTSLEVARRGPNLRIQVGSFQTAPLGKECVPIHTLLKDHQKILPRFIHDPLVYPHIKRAGNDLCAGYKFFGRFYAAATLRNVNRNDYFVGNLTELPPIKLSEVAIMALEHAFGKNVTELDNFVTEWAAPQPNGQGVWWDQQNDRIIAKYGNGLTLSILGTNFLEAAVFFPRYLENILNSTGPIQSLQIQVLNNSQTERNNSVAASPLCMWTHDGNLAGTNHDSSAPNLDDRISSSFRTAVKNRR